MSGWDESSERMGGVIMGWEQGYEPYVMKLLWHGGFTLRPTGFLLGETYGERGGPTRCHVGNGVGGRGHLRPRRAHHDLREPLRGAGVGEGLTQTGGGLKRG